MWVDLAAGSGWCGDAEGDKFARFEHIAGSSHKDTLFGDGSNNTMEGKAGSDELHGNAGADNLLGGSNDDRLWGDRGPDHLFGGTGNDTFLYASVSDSHFIPPGSAPFGGIDIVHDFVSAAIGGSDKIDLSAIDANTTATAAGDQRFTLTT